MAATLLDLRNEVKTLLNNDDFFTDANLNIHINASYREHYGIVRDGLQNILAIEDFIDTTANTRNYDLNSVKTSGREPFQIINVKYLGSDISSISYLDLTYETRTKQDDISTTGIPQTYEIVGNEVILGLPPNKTLTDGLKIRFVPFPIKLVDDADEIEFIFTGDGEDCIIYFAVMLAKAQEETWDPGSGAAGHFLNLYEKLLFRFKNGIEMRAFEEDEIETFLNDGVDY